MNSIILMAQEKSRNEYNHEYPCYQKPQEKNKRKGKLEKLYHQNGQLSSMVYYLNNGMKDTHVSFNENGELTDISCGLYSISKQEAKWCGRDGMLRRVMLYHENGEKKGFKYYHNAKQEKKDLRCFQDVRGKFIFISNYMNGIKHGEDVCFFNGIKTKITLWDSGKIVGQRLYYKNKQIQYYEKKLYDRYFSVKKYYKTGTLHQEGISQKFDFKENSIMPMGIQRTYNEEGQLVFECYWDDGVKSKEKYYLEEDKKTS